MDVADNVWTDTMAWFATVSNSRDEVAGTTEDPLREGLLERQNPADPQARTPGQDN